MIEIKVSYDRDGAFARKACEPWAALALTPDEKSGIEDPIEMERAAEAALDRAHTRFIVSDDADAVLEGIAPYVDRHGFTRLVFHFPGDDQRRQIDAFCDDVLPKLQARWS
jgi:coenzyme F420-dependent glucose-6-phosphate dehydrogenase